MQLIRPDAPVVVLNDTDIELALSVARQRRLTSIREGWTERYGAPSEIRWDREVEGAAAECAAAKILNIFWDGNPGVDRRKEPDVGPFDVRTTEHPNGCLILHPDDRNDRIHLLMVGLIPTFRAVGWMLGEEGKRREWWRDPTGKNRHAFFAPQKSLAHWPPPDPEFYLARRLKLLAERKVA